MRLFGVGFVAAAALAALAMGSPIPVAAAVGLVLILSSMRYPRVAAITVMVLWAGPFATQLAGRRVAGIPVDAADVVLVAALVGHVGRCVRDRRPLITGTSSGLFWWPIALYLVIVLVGTVRGVMAGNALGTASDALFALSALSAYLLFRVTYAGRIRTFAWDITIVAAVGCGLLVVGSALGYAPHLGVVVDHYDTRGVQDAQLRVDAPVNRLAIPAILLVALGGVPYKSRGAWQRVLLLVPMIAALGMSMTRSTWLPVIAAVVVLPALTTTWDRAFSALMKRGVVAGLVLVLAVGAAASGAAGSYVQGVAVRLLSAGDSDVLQDDSYQQRLVENRKAYLRIAEEPVLGIGFPRAYGAFVPYFPKELDVPVWLPRYFIHNSYLGVVMWFGIPGLLALGALLVAILGLARRCVMTHPLNRVAPLAVLGTLGILALMSSFQTQLSYEPFYLVMAVILALADVWLDRERALAHMGDHSPRWRTARRASGLLRR